MTPFYITILGYSYDPRNLVLSSIIHRQELCLLVSYVLKLDFL